MKDDNCLIMPLWMAYNAFKNAISHFYSFLPTPPGQPHTTARGKYETPIEKLVAL
jgi:hypothetical protein